METSPKALRTALEVSKSLGFAVLGAVAVTGTIEAYEANPTIGIVLAPLPAFVALGATSASVAIWYQAWHPE